MATLTEEIYEAIRNDIINLRIKPGERLSEAKLAKKYKVSRAPIRNVLQKLQQEEFVLVKRQIGTIIMPVSYQKAKDVLEIRLLLEPYAAEIAARRITEEDLRSSVSGPYAGTRYLNPCQIITSAMDSRLNHAGMTPLYRWVAAGAMRE